MGHTAQRDREVLFVRPHYYQSQTVVVGRKAYAVAGLGDVRGKTICVTVGNSTYAELSANGARLMLFDSAPRLVDKLRLGGCSLAAQDDSFFAAYFQQADFAAANSVKFGFAPLPWGAAVAREGEQVLADALSAALKKNACRRQTGAPGTATRRGVSLFGATARRVGGRLLKVCAICWRQLFAAAARQPVAGHAVCG